MFGASCRREDSGGHEGYSEDGVGTYIQLDGTIGRVTFDGVIAERIGRAGILVRREQHIGAALIVVDDIGGDVIECAFGRVLLPGEHAAYDSDGVADRAAYVEAENDGNAGLDVREDGMADVETRETKGLITGLGYRPYHCVRREAVRRVG